MPASVKKKKNKRSPRSQIRLRKNDTVIVNAGKDRGKTGKVLRVLTKENRVLVEKVNMVKKHSQPSQGNPYGGIQETEAPLHVSNVQLLSPKTNKGVRIRFEEKNGKKVRVDQHGSELDK
jgi:large subunit ribosomal protein L24